MSPLRMQRGVERPQGPDGVRLDATAVRLRDLTPVVIRPTRPEDAREIAEFVAHLSRQSIELRFCSVVRDEMLEAEVRGGSTEGDRLSLVMETVERSPRVVGHAEFVRYASDRARAEVAFLVADEFQGRGAGTLLLYELARIAGTLGVDRFSAIVLPENLAMRDVLLYAGFPHAVAHDRGMLLVELDVRRPPRGRFEASGPALS